ncbi:MAG: DUF1810 domain-containing protein [Betaproteobacteria bacterium]
MPADSHDLERFVTAQASVFATVCEELRAGEKQSHWMWFIFPQLRALGHSSMAKHYGLADLAEAQTYWHHPVLGERLRLCTALVLGVSGRTANEIFGSPDDLKLRSCVTLFEAAAPEEAGFGRVLERYYAGKRDAATLRLLKGGA